MKYTVRRGSQEIGKFELADIKALMNAGVILPTDYFLFHGISEWKPVSSLFAQEASTQQVGPSCSSCLSTDVMKASAAYDLHVKQHSLSASTLSGLKFWASGKTTNQVGTNCKPPTKPELTEGATGWKNLVSVCSMFAAMFILIALVSPGRGVEGGYLATGIITAFVAFLSHGKWKARVAEIEADQQKAMNLYRAQLADYDRTWRCNKCGVLYQQ